LLMRLLVGNVIIALMSRAFHASSNASLAPNSLSLSLSLLACIDRRIALLSVIGLLSSSVVSRSSLTKVLVKRDMKMARNTPQISARRDNDARPIPPRRVVLHAWFTLFESLGFSASFSAMSPPVVVGGEQRVDSRPSSASNVCCWSPLLLPLLHSTSSSLLRSSATSVSSH